jgi:hypothetical protein
VMMLDMVMGVVLSFDGNTTCDNSDMLRTFQHKRNPT